MSKSRYVAFALLLPLASVGTALIGQTPAPPHSVSTSAAASPSAVSAERLARIDGMLQSYVDRGLIPGAVALVLRDGRPIYQKAVGWADKEAGRPMRMDTMFRIASQTKAITSVTVLTLVEEGKLSLSDHVGSYIPSFAKTTVAVRNGDAMTIVPAKRRSRFGICSRTRRASRMASSRTLRASTEPKGSDLQPEPGGILPTSASLSAMRWTVSALCRSSPSPARHGCMGTTPTCWAV
jgi:CubicO group peptidase (beta-lactamase class C family)